MGGVSYLSKLQLRVILRSHGYFYSTFMYALRKGGVGEEPMVVDSGMGFSFL